MMHGPLMIARFGESDNSGSGGSAGTPARLVIIADVSKSADIRHMTEWFGPVCRVAIRGEARL